MHYFKPAIRRLPFTKKRRILKKIPNLNGLNSIKFEYQVDWLRTVMATGWNLMW